MDYEKSLMMHNGIGFLIAVLMIFFMAVGIGSIINREIKNPKTDTGVDTTAMSLIKIVDCFTELNKNLEELIEAQKKQNEAMKQELNSRIQNYPRTTLEIRPYENILNIATSSFGYELPPTLQNFLNSNGLSSSSMFYQLKGRN